MVTRILGPDGQPIRLAELSEPQTSRVGYLHQEFQGHPSRGLTPSKLANILDQAETGDLVAQSDLFEDMEEKDGHIASDMGKRRRALLQLDWDVVAPPSPYDDEKAAAKQLKELLGEIPDFEDALFDCTDAIGKGFACLEIEWHRVEKWWVPKTITHRPQSWFRLERGYRQEIRLRDNTAAGAPLQPFGWLTHVHRAKSGYLERAGLFRVLVWPYLFKNYSVADLAEFLEIYGIPLRLGKYPPGSNEQEKLTLLRALTSLGHNAAGIIPEGMLIDFKDAATGDPDAFQLMIEWCERTQSKVILGGTLTSQADGKTSTNALGNVHQEVRKDLRDADSKQLAATLTRDLLYPMAALNGLAPRGHRRASRFVFPVEETEDLQTYSEALPKLVSMGMRIPRRWAQEKLGIPEPEGDETDLLVAPVQEAGVEALTARLPATQVRPRYAPPDLRELDALLDTIEAGGALQPQAEAMLTPLLEAATADPDTFAARLAALYPDLDDSALQDALDRLLFAASVSGALHADRR